MFLVQILLAASSAQALPAAPTIQRPRDPFVFRCVLDKRVRIVTLALSDEMWAAYDTTTCGLYKTWKGGVKFDGAVYTTVHGPTPSSRGADYQHGVDGDVWQARVGDQVVAARALWRGYRLENGGCVLLYDVVLPDGRAVRVEERPESMRADKVFDATQLEEWGLEPALPGFVRRFHAPDVPAGVVVALLARTDAPRGRFIDAGGAAQEKLIDARDERGVVTSTEIQSLVWLDANRKVNSVTQFFDPIELPAPDAKSGDAKSSGAKGGAR